MLREFSAGVIIYYQYKTYPRLYLLLKYPSGYWDLTKGKIEQGETLEEAAIRETREETGLEIQLDPGFKEKLEYFFNSKNQTAVLVHKEVVFFTGRASTNRITLSDEHQDYAWLNAEDTYNQLTFKNARNVFEKALVFLDKQPSQ